jgi:hypothetical protein
MQILYFFLLCVFIPQVNAWDGYDWDKGNSIEIEKGNLVREGETIDFYEYGRGYATMDIDSIDRYGNHMEIEGIDNETGETRTFEMD